MSDQSLISGAGGLGGGGKGGGGGGNTRTPTEAGDNLNSSATVEVIDLLGEGEIEGFATPSKAGYAKGGSDWNSAMLKDIYLGNTPILRQGASNTAPLPSDFNFKSVGVDVRYGTQSQSAINSNTGSGSASTEVAVGVQVDQATPIVRTITDSNVDAVRVTVTVPALQAFEDSGDVGGEAAHVVVELQRNGGGFTLVVSDVIRGRTPDSYQRDYMVAVTGPFPVDIRVSRFNPDSSSAKIVNAFIWTSYTEILAEKFRYPNSALVGIRVNAEQFSSIPVRSFRVRGLKVQIPSNGTVDLATGRITYSGIWNGTFGAARWTSDPAWCLWNLLTSKRFGFGDFITATTLDKWAFYSASQYCNELVPTGFGGTEPRFSMNCLIQTQEESYKLINDLCSVFRAMPYWSTGALTVAQDKPADSSYLFTLANVTEEGFNYAGSDNRVRPTVAVVSYLDLNTKDIAYEVVEDAAAVIKYGAQTVELSAFACTSRGQAARLGEWLLYSSQYETEVVSFTASIDAGVIVRPGQIIEVADPARAGARRGGRITAATTTTVTVDNADGLPSSGGTLSVILKNGTVEARTVSSRSGAVITVSTAFSSAPGVNAIWLYNGGGILPTLWRVVTVQEQDGASYAVSALSYNASKYAFIDRDRPLQSRDVTNLNLVPAAPTNLLITEALYTYQAEVRAKVIISWRQVLGVNQYRVRWRKNSSNWTTITTQSPDHEILNITPGRFEVEVFSLNSVNQISTTALAGSINALGKTAPPSNVTAFTATLDPDLGVTLTWAPIADLDLRGYEIWEGSAFGVGNKVGLFAATAKKIGLMPTGTTTWHIKALDTSGIYSLTSASTSLTISGAAVPLTSGSFAGEMFVFEWTKVTGSLATDSYTIRYGTTSSTWTTATPLTTTKSTTYNVKANWLGTRRFFVAAVDLKGNIGTVGYFDAIVNAPTQPVISQQVIDNNVLLRWNDCTQTLPLDSYELRRGSTWAGGTVIGTKKGQFTTVFEITSGNFTYWLAGIDLAGNYGTPGSVLAVVNQPPDYVQSYSEDSTFSGTRTNTAIDTGTLVAAVNTAETWQSHFTTRSWTTLQDQVTAGFPVYAQPSATSGSYVEEIDIGAVLASSKITSALSSTNVIGSTTITPTLSVKTTAGGAWTDYPGVELVYATNFRYVKVAYAFASAGGNDLLRISRLSIKLDKKLRSDTGTGTANSGDVGGTTVTFNVPFIDIEGISVTPSGTTAVIAVYDFVDAPNPTSFKVLLFNTSGTRVSGGFSWQVRGT